MNEKYKNVTCFMLGFQRIFIVIRSSIKNPYNIGLLEKISKYCLLLKEGHSTKFETFKSEIIEVVKEYEETKKLLENALKVCEISFITNNLCEINRYLSIISETALEACRQLIQKNFPHINIFSTMLSKGSIFFCIFLSLWNPI